MGFRPDGFQCCINITYVYDSNRALTRRALLDIVAQSRGRFAPNVAIPRILDLLDRYEIKATFLRARKTLGDYLSFSLSAFVRAGRTV